MEFRQATAVLSAFERHGVRYVLIGSMAMAAQGLIRATRGIDILTRLGEAFRFSDIVSEDLVVDGVRVHVATPLMLYRMKRNTVRAQDQLDAQMLKERFQLEDE